MKSKNFQNLNKITFLNLAFGCQSPNKTFNGIYYCEIFTQK